MLTDRTMILLRRWRYALRNHCGKFESLVPLLPLIQPKYRDHFANEKTTILIEGYPRSANTFAVAAFLVAQNPEQPRIARHLHAAGHVARAVRLGVPAIVLFRAPLDAAGSLIQRLPIVSPKRALADYIQFYRRVLQMADRLVVASFDRVTNDFGSVITEVNEHYGARFKPFRHNESNERAAMHIVEQMDQSDTGLSTVTESHVGRPSLERRRSRDAIIKSLASETVLPWRKEAESLFLELKQLENERIF